jgi:hypothetical protein
MERFPRLSVSDETEIRRMEAHDFKKSVIERQPILERAETSEMKCG